MVARALTLVAALIALAFSGCLENGGTGLSSTPSPVANATTSEAAPAPEPSPSTSTPATSTAVAEPENAAPLANVTVTRADETLRPDDGGRIAIQSGETVTLDASGSTDADKDELAFAWTIDGETNGTTTAVLEVMLPDGYHEIGLQVTDGKATDSLVVAIEVIGAVVQEGGASKAIKYRFTSAFSAGSTTEHPATPSAAASRPFDVPAGAKMLIVHLRWSTSTAENPMVSDLDLLVKDAAGGTALDLVAGRNFEYGTVTDEAKLVPGTWTADVIPFLVPVNTPWTLDVIVFLATPESIQFTGTVQAQANPQGASGPGTGVKNHDFAVPDGTTIIVGRLTWVTQGNTNGRHPNDLNLNVRVGTSSEIATSGIGGWEFGYKAADAGTTLPAGARQAQVVPIVAADAVYTLTLYWA